MIVKYCSLLCLVFSLLTVVQAQPAESHSGVVPDVDLRRVVALILRVEFKSPAKRKTIYLAHDNIQKNWLPQIEHINFRFLSDAEREDQGSPVYFFTKPVISNGAYEIEFANGDPDCSYQGDTWRFQISAAGVELKKVQSGGGRYCSNEQFRVAGKMNVYKDELSGYKFFNRGKLKGIKLGVSTSADIIKRFGENCQYNCAYDQNWDISFTYFGKLGTTVTLNGKKTQDVTKPQYVGRLASFYLYPKSPLSFETVKFPPYFKQDLRRGFGGDSSGLSYSDSSTIYNDKYGLRYKITNEFKSNNAAFHHKKGELQSISYTILEQLKDKLFVTKQITSGF